MDLKAIAQKWQLRWKEQNAFRSKESKKPKFYCLEMFPYPSGKLHMGHVRNYSIGDAFARFKRMQGFSVLYPMGYDAFGLPAENAAIKHSTHPQKWTESCIAQMKEQQVQLGFSYDWNREIWTCLAEYYKWNQWLFVRMLEKGLAYRMASVANWCESCATVLANEQVVDGKCWRCKMLVKVKSMEQWFFRITNYAEELLNDIKNLEHWPERVKIMQENWIGRSEGTLVKFVVGDKTIEVFTTRPDTLFGCTFIVLAPEHPLVLELVKGSDKEAEVQEFIRKVVVEERVSRTEEKSKQGVFTGKYAVNPVNGAKVAIFVANFVLMEYGTGAVMAVPAHDQRDYEFAVKYGLDVKYVIKGNEVVSGCAYAGEGVLVDSAQFSGMSNKKAGVLITGWLEKDGKAKACVQYKLRDWLVSRQRYWGTPIPVVYCDACGIVPEVKLPVVLTEKADFTGKGNPLNTPSFVVTKCPKCGLKARRETDTMDTFVDSSWYFLRFTDPKNKKEIFSADKAKYWMPVNQYIGGIEHAVLHLLYARFICKVLRDLGCVSFSEPFERLLCQGMVTLGGAAMSKSKGNVVDPGVIIDKYGSDVCRAFVLFAAHPEKELEWNDDGVDSVHKFLLRFVSVLEFNGDGSKDKHFISKTHDAIRLVSERLECFELNSALQAIMEAVSFIHQNKEKISSAVLKQYYPVFCQLISPFAPHLAEECWELLGKKTFVSLSRWPKYNARLVKPEFDAADGLVSTVIADVKTVVGLTNIVPKRIHLIVAASWKQELYLQLKELLKASRDVSVILKTLMQTSLKVHGEQVSKLVPKLIASPQRIPVVVFSQKEELRLLSGQVLAKLYNCEVVFEKEQDSAHEKARNSMPGKPAIIVE